MGWGGGGGENPELTETILDLNGKNSDLTGFPLKGLGFHYATRQSRGLRFKLSSVLENKKIVQLSVRLVTIPLRHRLPQFVISHSQKPLNGGTFLLRQDRKCSDT